MLSPSERMPISDERRLAVAQWIQSNYRPALRVITEGSKLEQEPQQEFEIREYQLEAWASIWDARQAGKQTGLAHLATGLGKTSVGVFDFLKFREEYRQTGLREPRGLFVSHQEGINEQAAKRFRHYIPDLKIYTFGARQSIPQNGMTFATVQGLGNKINQIDPGHFDYIIYDEAHHMKAKTWEKVVKHFRPQFQLALTATPDRMDRRNIREHFGEELYSMGLAEAIAAGWLAEPDYHIVFDDIVKQLMEEGFEPDTLKKLHELFTVRPRNEIIAKNIREERDRIGLDAAKTIVFCEDITHAEEMAAQLGGQAYHSKLHKDDLVQVRNDFRSGDLQIICTVDMFNEGIDIPDARLIVFLRSTQSGTIFEQQLGRGLRRILGKDRVSVLDFVANIERIAKIHDLSRAIGHYAKRLGRDEIGGDDLLFKKGNAEELTALGLRIHTKHGDFNFSRLAVDLLDKYNALKNRPDYSEFVGYSNEELIELALRLKPYDPLCVREIKRLSKDKKFVCYATILDRFGSLSEFQLACGFEREKADKPEPIKPAPEGSSSIIELAEELGVTRTTFLGYAGESGVSAEKYRFKTRVRYGLTKEQIARIHQHPVVAERSRSKGQIKIKKFANQINVPLSAVKKEIETLLAQANKEENVVFGPVIANSLDERQRDILEQRLSKLAVAPKDWVSTNRAAQTLGISDKSVCRIAKELGIEPMPARSRGHPSNVLSPEQLKRIAAHPLVKTERAPADHVNVRQFAQRNGLTYRKVFRAIKKLSLELPTHKYGSIASKSIGPEEARILRGYLDLPESPQKTETPRPSSFSSMGLGDIIHLAITLKPAGALTKLEMRALAKEGRFPDQETLEDKFGSVPAFQSLYKQARQQLGRYK